MKHLSPTKSMKVAPAGGAGSAESKSSYGSPPRGGKPGRLPPMNSAPPRAIAGAGSAVAGASGKGFTNPNPLGMQSRQKAKTLNSMKTDRDVLIDRVQRKVGTAPPLDEPLEYDFDELLAETEWRSSDSDVDEDEELNRMMIGIKIFDEEDAEAKKSTFEHVIVDEYAYENLEGDDYLLTAFVAPDKYKAMEKRDKEIFNNGDANLWDTGPLQMGTMGPGIALYFAFIKAMAFFFLAASVFAIPGMVASFQGTRVTEGEKDPLSLIVFTLGNVGPPDPPKNGSVSALAEVREVKCPLLVSTTGGAPARDPNCVPDTVNFLFMETDEVLTSLTITAGDFLYSVIFMCLIVWYRRKIEAVEAAIDKDNVTASDFAVYVKGLPRDTSEEEVLEHFSDLYQLSEMDWEFDGWCCKQIGYKKGRKPSHIRDRGRLESDSAGREHVRYKQPKFKTVQNVDCHGKASYLNTWVAEVSLARPNGNVIRTFQKRKEMNAKLRAAKGLVKKFDARSRFFDEDKKAAALKKLAKVQAKYDKMNRKPIVIDRDTTIAAFVVFNHEESFIHCVEDYKGSFGCWARTFQPPPLRFREREYRLSVRPAPDPSNIRWENLEVTPGKRALRKAGTNFVTLLLLLISFGIALASQNVQTEFKRISPAEVFCDETLPSLYLGNVTHKGLRRNRTADWWDCAPGTHWLEYDSPAWDRALYNGSVAPVNKCLSPCVDPLDLTTECPGPLKTTYLRSAPASCYCRAQLESAGGSLLSAITDVIDTEGDLCADYATKYGTAQALGLGAPGITVTINVVLNKVLIGLTLAERHHTVSEEVSAITIKIFLAMFLNTGLIILLVNAQLPGDAGAALASTGTGLLNGEYQGFTKDWYTAVGAKIMTTMMANAFAPQAAPLGKALVLPKLKQRLLADKQTTQGRLNELYRAPDFMIAERYPQLLMNMFVTLFYCSGLPLLLPFAFIGFTATYWVDKWLILRKLPQPPQYDKNLAELAADLMPLAILLHLLIGMWMYGEPSVLISTPVDLESYSLGNVFEPKKMYNSLVRLVKSFDQFNTSERMIRQNTFPLVLLTVIVIFGTAAYKVALPFLRAFFKRFLQVISCGLWADDPNKVAGLLYRDREWNPPFTELFRMQLDPEDPEALSEAEQMEGWRINIVDQQHVKVRLWGDSGTLDGVGHMRDTEMRTWEVIRSKNLHTYDIMRNEVYTGALVAMAEEARRQELRKKREAKDPGNKAKAKPTGAAAIADL